MKAIEATKKIVKRYSHAWVFLYAFIYMPWFLYLERRTGVDYYIIHSPIDNYIPFVEYFIVPYLLWFLFIAVTVGYFFFTDKWGFSAVRILIHRNDAFPADMHVLPERAESSSCCI